MPQNGYTRETLMFVRGHEINNRRLNDGLSKWITWQNLLFEKSRMPVTHHYQDACIACTWTLYK